MAAPGWWDVHRQLQKGSRGADVTALQRKLIEDSGDPLPVSGVFDDATEKAVVSRRQAQIFRSRMREFPR